MRWNSPSSPVEATWVPPHSSRETDSTSTMRTQSPYFSPNSAIAPRRSASSRVVSIARTGWLSVDPAGHEPLDRGQLVVREALAVREVEAQLVRADVGAGLAHVVAEPIAQRSVQQVGRGVVAHRGEPLGALDDGLGRLARARARPRAARAPAPGRRRAGTRPPRARARWGSRPARCRRPGRRPPGRTGTPRAWPAPSRWRARRLAARCPPRSSRSRRSACESRRRGRSAAPRRGPRAARRRRPRWHTRRRAATPRAPPPSAPRSPRRRPTAPPRRAAPWSSRRGSRRCRAAGRRPRRRPTRSARAWRRSISSASRRSPCSSVRPKLSSSDARPALDRRPLALSSG